MKTRAGSKLFIWFLCVSFIYLMSGFPQAIAAARETGLPLGEMVSTGEVKFEARENVWKDVEPSHFPVFCCMKIKTEKGGAVLTLRDNCQIEAGQGSLFFMDQGNQFHLMTGELSFRILSRSEMVFEVGTLSIIRSGTHLAASSNTFQTSPRVEDTIGSIAIHSNGSVSVKTTQGSLSILNRARNVLATLSGKDAVTVPSVMVSRKDTTVVAQAGPTDQDQVAGSTGTGTGGTFLGLSGGTWTWIGIGALALGAGVGIGIAATPSPSTQTVVPLCR